MSVDRKSILITGCSSGIGYCSAEMLHQRGYKVYATARKPEDLERLRQLGVTALELEVTDYEQVDQVLDYIERDNGTLYALFNNAGYSQVGACEDLSPEALEAQFATNFFAPVEIGNRVLRRFMRPQGYGRIIQNSSVFGMTSMPFRAAYSSSKYALEAFSDALRQEHDNFDTGIRISLIEPGPIVSRVRQNKQLYFERYIEPVMAQSPYAEVYRKMQNALAMKGRIPMTLGPETVVDKLIHALESERPAPRYYVTRMAYIFITAKRLLSHRGFDRFSARISKKETG
ncbi:MAG: SDR family NAD(P)-dependent oxidoreductase [Pseudomonadota bacterium]